MHEEVMAAVRETRSMLLPYWGKIDGAKKDSVDEYSIVTELDMSVEKYLAESLAKIEPGVPLVGEEMGGSRDQNKFWLCDPIDGTLQFARGLPFCTVQLARIENGRVTFSIIYDFLNDMLYHAVRGGGAYQNGEKIHVSDRPIDRTIVILESKIHENQRNFELSANMAKRMQTMRSLVAGYELIFVATGKLEGRISFDPWGKDYDYAAGSLLVEEAGGIVANVGSSTYDFRDPQLIAATPAVFHMLTDGPDALLPITK